MPTWKPIPGWPEYEASDSGVVRRVGCAAPLRGHPDKDGYLRIVLSRGRQRTTIGIHRAVAQAFHGLSPHQVRHLDGDVSNNKPSNLAYGTAKDNADDRAGHGRTLRGELHGSAKASDADVLAALERSRIVGVKAAAGEIGLTQSGLSMIRTGRSRRHLTGSH